MMNIIYDILDYHILTYVYMYVCVTYVCVRACVFGLLIAVTTVPAFSDCA